MSKTNCINVIQEKELISCVCGRPVGYFDRADKTEIITFYNVRELLFRPHVTYVQHDVVNKENVQNVIISETIEDGDCSVVGDCDATKILIHPFLEAEAGAQSQESPGIKVAAIASGDFVTFNEDLVMGYFRDAIKRSMNGKESETLASVSDENLQNESTEVSTAHSMFNDRIQEYGLDEFLISGVTAESGANCTGFDLNLELGEEI